MRHLKPEAIGNFVSFGLVYLDQRILILLIGNAPSRTGAPPAENIQVIQPALGFQQYSALHVRLGRNLCVADNERQPRAYPAEIYYVVVPHQLMLVSCI